MALDQSGTVLVAAGIGAAAVLLSQLISTIAGARRDRRLQAVSDQVRAEERTAAERDRFFDLRRHLYARFLSRLLPWVHYVGHISSDTPGERHPPEDYKTFEGGVNEMRSELGLIAPREVIIASEGLWTVLVTSLVQNDYRHHYPRERRESLSSGALDGWTACQRLMRADLAGDELSAPDITTWGGRTVDETEPARAIVKELREEAQRREAPTTRTEPQEAD